MKSERLTKEQRAAISRLGGLATAKKMPAEWRTMRARKAAIARWSRPSI